MTKTKTLKSNKLTQSLEKSPSFHLLLPTYQKSLHDLATTGPLSLQKALTSILHQEKPADLQSVFFTEEILQNFVERNLHLPPQQELLAEYRAYAQHLIESFILLSLPEKQKILPQLASLNLDALKKLINLYKFGHHKQDQYLRKFVEKDPQLAAKFQLLTKSLAN